MKRCGSRARDGFTIIELMMVVLIIAVLAGLVLSIVNVAGRKSDRAKAVAEMEKIKNALEEFRVEKGQYPDTMGLAISPPNDPWGNAYVYAKAGKFSFSLYSKGPDGKPGSEDDVSLDKGSM